jgi:demethylmenaquinone methyltransferase/2-methoxy-6-polyprenyl-1,4-benzoquinol methylase
VIPAFAGRSARRARARELMDFYWETIDACVSPETVLREFAEAGFAGTARTVTLGIFSEYVAAGRTGRKERPPATRRGAVMVFNS